MEIKRGLDLDPFSLTDTRVTHTLLPTEWLCRYLIPSPCRWWGLDAHVQKECFLTQKDRPGWNGSFSLILSSSCLWGFDQKQPSLAPAQAGTWGSTISPCAVGEFWRHWFRRWGIPRAWRLDHRAEHPQGSCLFSRNLGQGSHGLLFFFLRQDLSLNLELISSARLGDQAAPGTLLPVSDSMKQALSPPAVYMSAGNTLGSSSP